MYPEDLKYTESHEWARVDGDVVTIGITFYAQEEIQDVVYVELPEVGTTVARSSEFGVIESVKAAFDLYAPVSGEVVGINDKLEEQPELVNESPYEGGWMVQIKMSQPEELDALMDATAYQEVLATEEA